MKNIIAIVVILIVFFSCKKDQVELTLNSNSTSLKRAETFQLAVNGATINDKFTYTTGNKFIASVDESGLIKGERIGTTTITVSSSDFTGECIVSVTPVYNTFNEPITTYGLTKSEIRAKEKRTFGTETSSGLLFLGGNSEKYVIYLFDTNGKSTSSCIVLSSAYTSELAKYMLERYIIVSTDPVGGLSVDQSFAITTELQTNLDWWVLYVPAKVTKSAVIGSSSNDINNLIELIKNKKLK